MDVLEPFMKSPSSTPSFSSSPSNSSFPSTSYSPSPIYFPSSSSFPVMYSNNCSASMTHRLTFLDASLIAVYARFGFLSDARKVFAAIPVEGLHHLLLWNSIIRANVSHGYHQHALRLYLEMRNLGIFPDGFTLPLIIRACSSLAVSDLCRIVHCHALQLGFQNHLHVVNELVGKYGKHERMEDSRQLFDGMSVRSLVSWNTMVSGYAFNCDSIGASAIFKRMELEG
ncbi:putative pentatricopeptide repeat-containing protein At1g17630 [Vigna umbellata]|uniref:putative pentatricopeptide repeat-containing protein At1g17630 n=1 Tax=Vigna umbellata TaxID=87088 RepID=UPI001F5E7C87|nr:putative pentatricopeptide repeat-containing protein At1g17630 [Vigna umbellata]